MSKIEDKILEKKLNRYSIIVSVIVLLLVGMMRKVKFDLGVDFHFLPPFHASINALTAVVLLLAYNEVMRQQFNSHRKLIYVAMALSLLFLMSYVLYHITTPETPYCHEGNIRYVYFFFLITHVILAALILPFVLFTFTRAYTNQFERHKKMARWVFPLWLYVAVSGPICYIMLMDCY